jgi:hypothetical protein
MRTTARESHEAGVLLLEYAAEFKRRKSLLGDDEAFKLALLAHPDLAEQYTGCPVRRDCTEEVRKVFENADSADRHLTAIEKLDAIVESTRNPLTRAKDWPATICRMHQHLDVVRDAANEVFNKLVDDLASQNAGNRVRTDPSPLRTGDPSQIL